VHQPPRPNPGNPPESYALERGYAVFYRRVSNAERDAWLATGKLEGEPGGMELGKHVTTSETLARTWGRKLVEWRREENPGYVLAIRIHAEAADSVDFVGPRTDGIGACYFIPTEHLADAIITELTTP
jgi:hypothetical protein